MRKQSSHDGTYGLLSFSFFPLPSLCNDLYAAFGKIQFSSTLFLFSWTNFYQIHLVIPVSYFFLSLMRYQTRGKWNLGAELRPLLPKGVSLPLGINHGVPLARAKMPTLSSERFSLQIFVNISQMLWDLLWEKFSKIVQARTYSSYLFAELYMMSEELLQRWR